MQVLDQAARGDVENGFDFLPGVMPGERPNL